jgi:hypothetical protein
VRAGADRWSLLAWKSPYNVVYVHESHKEIISILIFRKHYIGASAAKPLVTIVFSIVARGLAVEPPIWHEGLTNLSKQTRKRLFAFE